MKTFSIYTVVSELVNIPSIFFVVDGQRSLRLRKPTVHGRKSSINRNRIDTE